MRMTKYIALLLMICMIPLHADFAKLGTSGAQFLKISVGRGAAMGEAFVAISDDASATFWNPSGLASVTNREISFYHNEWIADIRHDYLTAVFPLGGFGTMGVSITALTMGEMEITDIDDPNTSIREDTGTGTFFNAADYAVGFSFGRMFTDRLAAGITLKAVQEQIWHMSATGVALDFGIHYNTGVSGLRLAAAMNNFGTDIAFSGRDLEFADEPFPNSPVFYELVPAAYRATPFPLPLMFRFGVAFDPVSNENNRLTVALDLNHPNDNYETVNLGLEYGYLNTLFLRVGYKMYTNMEYMRAMTGGEPVLDTVENVMTYPDWGDDFVQLLNNFSAGVGFHLKTGVTQFKIDYAYMNKGILSHTHRIGLSIVF
ncbi:MAG: PorV/PorQ family protein [candidate division WOR-3 bacterium]|nr:MAG: PorV/PorQ family protein [candidate division WOR-3 bacterium]